MVAACDNFYKLLSSGVYGVFYFAGHGFESAGENYLVGDTLHYDNYKKLKNSYLTFDKGVIFVVIRYCPNLIH